MGMRHFTITTAVVGAALAWPGAAMAAIVDWDFSEAEGWTANSVGSLTAAGWTVNSAANDDARFFVSFAQENNWDNVLRIEDQTNSGTPEASLSFGSAVTEGSLEIAAGVAGTASQQGHISLRAGATELFRVYLLNNNDVDIYHGGAGSPTRIAAPGFNRVQDYEVTWSVNANGTGGLASLSVGGAAVLGDVAFMAPGVPDSIVLKVGFGSGVNRIMLVDHLRISNVPEPAAAGLMWLGCLLGMGRRQRRR